ncbi:FAD-dependent oxidoreductase [Nocardioides sp. GXZ039]|uniref:FAD-dependent oxidoreductase n=1 Tax=Nocardioides sp. GXZ039 TaxID=3136018 RepID=UPI0030F4500B
MSTRILVVGAGVIGLSCAVRLLEDGHRVDVVARDLPLETTSAVAAGLIHAAGVEQSERVRGWSARSEAVYTDLATTQGAGCGVAMRVGTDAESGERIAPVLDVPTYLRWLTARVEALGGTVTRMNLSGLPSPGDEADEVVVNCSGLGARLLGSDPTVTPVAGQIVLVEQPASESPLDRWWLDARDPSSPAYVVPRDRDLVVGGTWEAGEWSRTPSPATADALLERAAEWEPALLRARVVRSKVGLRPARPEIRLERVDQVVHCYGHGGAGLGLAWGCADEVAALVEA